VWNHDVCVCLRVFDGARRKITLCGPASSLLSCFLGMCIVSAGERRGGGLSLLKRAFPSMSMCVGVQTVIRYCLTAAACLKDI